MKKVYFFVILLMSLFMVTSCQKELPEGFSDYMISQGGTGLGEDSPEISLDTNSLEFTAEGGSRSFNIKSNTSWTLSSDKSWCTVSPTSGRNNGSVTVKVDENTSTSSRTAMITLRSEIGILTVKVTQDGATQSHGSSKDYLSFEAVNSGTFTFSGTSGNSSIQYSLDSGSTWITLASGVASPTVSAGKEIWWKGNFTPIEPDFDEDEYGIGRFISTGNFNVKGNIMSLLYGDNFVGQTSLRGKNYAFYGLFRGCTGLTGAENLSLPATTLADYCYNYMFAYCTSLTTVPSNLLPATTLAEGCYIMMFMHCTNLTSAPELPATTLSNWCYYCMFGGCTSLTTAPVLPATALVNNCYMDMFSGCTGITSAPELPATSLADYCYNGMFHGCSGLTSAPKLPATTLATGCYMYMFDDCSGLTSAPELPATTMTKDCYEHMFAYCKSLKTAPVLPATTLAENCYYCMFQGCRSLNSITCFATDISATDCTSGWVSNVASSGTFKKASSMSSWTTGTSGIPSGWTVQNATPSPSQDRTFTVGGVQFKMIAVEGGTFTMGATSEQGSDADDDEKPAHSVTLSSYCIGETEVTQALWQAVMGSNPSYFSGSNRPVEQVSWNDCQDFISKLNAMTGENFRLPTEAEWEFAARGGNKSRGNKYAGSNSIDDVAWYDNNSSARTHDVATKQANELGLYDMSGNVWEWCYDWWGNYSSSAQTNPTGPASGGSRVFRGGGWGYRAGNCRTSFRYGNTPSIRGDLLGFRLAL